VDEVSASAIVRQQEDRPTEELSDRLKKLRERAEEIPDEVVETNSGGISPATLAGAGSLVQGVALTPEQQRRVELLKGIAPKEGRAQPFRMSAIDATYDSPFMPELEDTPETTVQPVRRERREKTRRRTRRRLNIRIDRFFVALALAAAVIAPFLVPGFRVGTLPPDNFTANSDAQNAFNQVHSLQSGDLALVAVEYGAASAGELDGVTDALLRHILLRSAFPVVVSGNAVGLLRAETRLEALSRDEAFLERIGSDRPLQANQDYYVVRYLPGSVIGLRAFSQDTANLLLADIRGQATNLQVRSLNDFALVTVITDRAEDLRAYAEQVAPLTRSPLMAAVSYSAAPLAEPYMQALGGGLLVGYADAYTYGDLIETVTARDISERVRIVPTLEPTPTVQAAAAETEATPTPRATRRAATPTPQPTAAPDTATVSADQAVNMRGGAGTDFPVLAAVPSGTELVVLGYNGDQSWVNVQLADGREGWIAASLLTIQTSQSAAPKLTIYSKRQVIEEGEEDETATSTRTPLPSATPIEVGTDEQADETSEAEASVTATRTATARPTRTALPSATPTPTEPPTEEATAELTAEATEAVVVAPQPPPPPSPGYRDERWYAMNMGIIASALIITLGMVINLVRGLLRRGRRG
jgi:SH3-like domain-containing protein